MTFEGPINGFVDLNEPAAAPNGHASNGEQKPPFDLELFNSKLLCGTAPPIQWLIDGSFRLGELGVIATMGAAGKSLLILSLALQVIDPATDLLFRNPMLGGEVVASGNVVLFCAEDNRNEVWRRLEQLDPGARIRKSSKFNIYIITMPDLSQLIPEKTRPLYIVKTDGRKITLDEGLDFIEEWVGRVNDLALVVIDPSQPFCGADLNVSAEAVQITFNALAALAARSNAAFILAHHMRKNGAKDITSPDEARESIRGSGDIVNRPRLSYALWPAGKDETNKVCRALGIPVRRNLVFHGAVVKANGLCNNEVQVYVRGESGLLVDRTATVKADYDANVGPIVDALVEGIADAAEAGRPFMRTGQAGLHDRRSELPDSLQHFGRDKLPKMADRLLQEGRLVLAIAGGSTVPKWLDVPDGIFALGQGSFAAGAPTGRSGRKSGNEP